MSGLARDGTTELISRDYMLRCERGQENNKISVQLTTSRSNNPEPYPIDPYSTKCANIYGPNNMHLTFPMPNIIGALCMYVYSIQHTL